ncbi:sulfite exporter TauE/SafE [Bacteriovorax sp. BSW11_IV]|nr:sulfite exporter TauE/SafE [Bacteriovorax sp. BSW11_IV]
MVLGIFAGTLSGLFGIGGGIVIVPTLVFCFKAMNFPDSMIMHMALGTSLATIFFTALNSVYAHHKKNNVSWNLVLKLGIGIVIGTASGGFLSHILSAKTLAIIFACYISFVSMKMWFGLNSEGVRRSVPLLVYNCVGFIIGFKSALLGIGGGTISIPFLTYSGEPMKKAVGVSAALGLPIAFVGAITYAMNGQSVAGLPEHSFGFIYVPALVGIVLTSSIFARFGAALSHKLPQDKMRKGFALFLMVVAIKTIISFL